MPPLQAAAALDALTWLVLVPMLEAAEADPARRSFWKHVFLTFESYNVGPQGPFPAVFLFHFPCFLASFLNLAGSGPRPPEPACACLLPTHLAHAAAAPAPLCTLCLPCR